MVSHTSTPIIETPLVLSLLRPIAFSTFYCYIQELQCFWFKSVDDESVDNPYTFVEIIFHHMLLVYYACKHISVGVVLFFDVSWIGLWHYFVHMKWVTLVRNIYTWTNIYVKNFFDFSMFKLPECNSLRCVL